MPLRSDSPRPATVWPGRAGPLMFHPSVKVGGLLSDIKWRGRPHFIHLKQQDKNLIRPLDARCVL